MWHQPVFTFSQSYSCDTLGGDKASTGMLTHTYPHNPPRKI